ncbi:outer membrane usher protein [Pseudomonas sp. TE3786]
MKYRAQLLIAGWVSVTQIFILGYIPTVLGGEQVAALDFDSSMLWGTPDEKASADLSRFSEGNPVPPGNMNVDLYLNGGIQKTTSVYFLPVPGKKSAVACFTQKELQFVGLALDKLPEEAATWMRDEHNKSDCRIIGSVVPGAEANFDFSEQRLDLSIPQAYLDERPKDYIDPKQWDRGITAGRLNYSLDMFNATSGGRTDTEGYAYLESGFNVQGWRIRNISSVASNRDGSSFQAQRTYAQTDIEPLKSTLTVGQNYTDGQLFNSYGLQGAFLSTDVRMLPPSLRNYAPVVTGNANTNAKVTIRQNNVVIYERAVPPGPFEINNLQAVGYGNDLEVTVTEADGTARKFSVPYSPLVQLLRPGQMKYSASLGQAWAPADDKYAPSVGQLNFQYGMNNYVTALGGAIASDDYTAIALGSAVSTYIGGISADYTYSNNRLDTTGSSNGDSLRFVYSTLIEPTNTNITLSSYRYSSRGFWSFNEFVAYENSLANVSSSLFDPYSYSGAKQKGRFDISLRQRFAPGFGSLFLSGSTRDFWNREGSDTQYQVSYSNRFSDLTYDLSATRVRNQNNNQYNEFRINFSIPIFASDYGRNYLSANTWSNSESGSQSQVQLGGVAGDDQQYTYGISTSQGLDSQNTQSSYGLSGSYQGPKALVTAGVSQGKDYRQSSLGIAGSVLAHSEGVTFGQTLGETVALVEAKDAQGARITNSSGAVLDGSGFGVVPYLSPFSRNSVELDPEGLSPDLQLKSTSSESIPVAGSIVKVKFETSKEQSVLINAAFVDGSPLPFGAEVLDSASQNLVGYVGQAGSIFARGIKLQGRLLVKLKERSCFIDYRADQRGQDDVSGVSRSLVTTTGVCRYE